MSIGSLFLAASVFLMGLLQDSVKTKPTDPIASINSEFFRAVSDGDNVSIKRLLDQKPMLLNARNNHGFTALQLSIMGRKPALTKLLLSYDPHLAISTAAALGRTDLLSRQIVPGLIDQRDSSTHLNPLQWAVIGGSTEAAQWLLDQGAAVDANAGSAPSVPLVIAIKRGNRDMVELLVRFGADTRRFYPGFGTPRTIALAEKRTELLDLLP